MKKAWQTAAPVAETFNAKTALNITLSTRDYSAFPQVRTFVSTGHASAGHAIGDVLQRGLVSTWIAKQVLLELPVAKHGSEVAAWDQHTSGAYQSQRRKAWVHVSRTGRFAPTVPDRASKQFAGVQPHFRGEHRGSCSILSPGYAILIAVGGMASFSVACALLREIDLLWNSIQMLRTSALRRSNVASGFQSMPTGLMFMVML